MTDLQQPTPDPASIVEFCRFWSGRVDTLDRQLSDNTWAPVAVALVVYPLVRIVIPAILHGIVPDVVRTVLKLI